jgi:hypothetical protein
VGALTNFLRVGYIPFGSPGDLISVMREAPFDIVGGPWPSGGFSGSGSSREFGGSLQRVTMSWYLACIYSAILGSLLGERTVEHKGL